MPEQAKAHRRPFWLFCSKNRWPWFTWWFNHPPGKSIYFPQKDTYAKAYYPFFSFRAQNSGRTWCPGTQPRTHAPKACPGPKPCTPPRRREGLGSPCGLNRKQRENPKPVFTLLKNCPPSHFCLENWCSSHLPKYRLGNPFWISSKETKRKPTSLVWALRRTRPKLEASCLLTRIPRCPKTTCLDKSGFIILTGGYQSQTMEFVVPFTHH